jgi:uncharacterized protein
LKVVNQYIIPFRGLKAGEHTFNFEVDKKFFEEYSELEISNGLLQVDVILTKKSGFIDLDFRFYGWVELLCDKCLELFKYPLKFDGQLIVKFKEIPEEPDDTVIFLHPNDDFIDLNQYIFDSIALTIPIQKYHPVDEKGKSQCDTSMLKIITDYSYEDLSDKQDTFDPRWSKLNDLLKDGNKNE